MENEEEVGLRFQLQDAKLTLYQEIPEITGKFGLGVQNEAGQKLRVLPRERTVHSKHLLPTTQEMILQMDITKWSMPKSD